MKIQALPMAVSPSNRSEATDWDVGMFLLLDGAEMTKRGMICTHIHILHIPVYMSVHNVNCVPNE